MSAEQEAMLTHLEEDKAQAQMRIQMTAAQNPQYFVRSTYAHGKGAREGLRKLGEGLIDQATTSEQRAADQEGKVELKRLDLLAKEQERAAARDDKVAEQAYRFGKDVERLEATNGMIQELLDQDDIAGYGYTEGYDSPGKMDTDGQLRLIIDELGRIKSGGAITEDEFASFSEMIKSGVELGDGSVWEGSETRLRKNLEQVQKFLKRKVASQERGLTQEARQFYNRNVANQDFDPRWSGPQRPVQIQED